MVDVDLGLVCSKDGETVEIVNLNGISQSCTCSVSFNGIPEESCTETDGDEQVDNENNRDFCSIRVADGSIMEFENGESLGDFLPTRCLGGSTEFPCYCNTDVPDQVECPYCTFLDVNGDLICSRQSESIVYEADPGEVLECACFSDLLSTCKPMGPTLPPVETSPPTASPVTITDAPTFIPTDSPTAKETSDPTDDAPVASPPATASPTSSQTSFETTFSPEFDKEMEMVGDRTPPQNPELGGCLYLNETTGLVNYIQRGESFGPDIHGPCSPTEDWPVVCNPAIPNGGMEYPYCVFETSPQVSDSRAAMDASNAVVCARNEDRVMVTLPDGISEECSCLYFNPLLGPSSSCPMVTISFSTTGGAESDEDPSTSPPYNEPNGDTSNINGDDVSSAYFPKKRLLVDSFGSIIVSLWVGVIIL
jgi:hypothetical protein